MRQFEQGAEDTTLRYESCTAGLATSGYSQCAGLVYDSQGNQLANTPLADRVYVQTNRYFTGTPVTKTGRRVFELALKYTF